MSWTGNVTPWKSVWRMEFLPIRVARYTCIGIGLVSNERVIQGNPCWVGFTDKAIACCIVLHALHD